MSDEHGRCRREAEEQYSTSSFLVLADALDRIEARLDAESTAGQAARQTAERLIVAERDEWRKRAEEAERCRDSLRLSAEEAWKVEHQRRRERDEAREELDALRERYRPRRFPEEKPDGLWVLTYWINQVWAALPVAGLRDGNIWCYAPPSPDATHYSAPAARADDGREAVPPPVSGTGETTTSEKPTAWGVVTRGGQTLWLAHTKRDAERAAAGAAEVVPLYPPVQPAAVVKLPRNPYDRHGDAYHYVFRIAEELYRQALDAAGVKWEEE